jgi:trimeric autotransporter adhesin
MTRTSTPTPPTMAQQRLWWATAFMAMLAMVLWLGLINPVYAATPAGTVIGNQATATYLDATGTSRNTSSNLVQTTVSQVKSFTLTADGAKTAAPGQTVYYPHTITNTGNGVDSYALNTPTAGGAFTHTGLTYYIDANGDGVPDNFTPITTSGAIAAGAQFKFVVAGVVPPSTATGLTGTIGLSVTDTGANNASNTDTTTVANSVINVTKAMSATGGPSPSAAPLTVTLTYTNSGTAAAANVLLTDVLPTGMTYVAGSGLWSGTGATALTDAAGGDGGAINYAVTGSTVTATVVSVPAGVTGSVTFRVNIASGLAPTVPANQALTTNTATYSTSTQASANTNSVTYTVGATAAVAATGQTVPAAPQGGTVPFSNVITNNGNATDSFDVTFPAVGTAGNNFPAGTTFALFKSDGVTSLLDTNGNGTADTGPVAPGATYTVILKATLPPTATGGPFSVTKTATSKNDPTKSATATDTLTSITNNTMDLTQNTARTDSAPPGTANAGNVATTGFGPGTATVIATNNVTPTASSSVTTPFKLFVNNTSGVADSFGLSVTSTIPAGWTVTFYNDGGAGTCATLGSAVTNSGPVAAGANKLICAVVTVPAINTGNAAPGTTNFTFNAQSVSTPTSSDSIVDAVVVGALHSVTLTPNGAQQTYPGGAVTYNHVLTNSGNGAETVTFATGFLTDSQVAAGWTSVAYVDTNTNGVLDVGTDALITTATSLSLAANTSQNLFVRVFAPGSATATSPADLTTLTATYDSGASSTSATDTTTVTNGLLLSKTQVAGNCGAALIAGPFSAAAIPAGPNTAPGKCVAYQISATNTTVGAITTVVLSDLVPANTTLAVTSCAAPAATGGATVGGASTEGATGAVTASLASLPSTGSFQLTFCVKINP